MTSNAELLIARAEALLAAPDGRHAARLAAFLARQATEDLINTRCASLCGVAAVGGTAKARLAILKSLDTTAAGPTLVAAWNELSGHCHHHAYQLSPTVAEVQAQCRALRENCLPTQASVACSTPATGVAGER